MTSSLVDLAADLAAPDFLPAVSLLWEPVTEEPDLALVFVVLLFASGAAFWATDV
jgi:hypothetical protein